MTRQALYVASVAAALSGLDTEHRLACMRDLEAQFIAEYRRAHPSAPAEAANAAFLDLARAIAAQMIS